MKLQGLLRMGAPVAVVLIAFFALSHTTSGDIEALDDRNQAASRALATQQRLNGDLSRFSAIEVEALATIERIELAIPPAVDVPQLIELLADAGEGDDLAIEIISPDPTPRPLDGPSPTGLPEDGSAGTLSRIEIGVSGTGTYPAVLGYLDRLTQSERLFRIRTIDLAAHAGADRLGFTIDLDAFTTQDTGPTVELGPQATPDTARPPVVFEEE